MTLTRLSHDVDCILCGSIQRIFLMETENIHGAYLINDEKFRLVKCQSCGMIYLNPQPLPEQMNRYYQKYWAELSESYVRKLLIFFTNFNRKKILQFKKKGRKE